MTRLTGHISAPPSMTTLPNLKSQSSIFSLACAHSGRGPSPVHLYRAAASLSTIDSLSVADASAPGRWDDGGGEGVEFRCKPLAAAGRDNNADDDK
jgi:hypothetical protein